MLLWQAQVLASEKAVISIRDKGNERAGASSAARMVQLDMM